MAKTLDIGINMIELIKTIGAVCASLAAIGGVVAGFWWMVRKIVRIADAVEQLKPNGGGSIADKVTHISKSVDELNKRVSQLEVFDTEIGPIIQELKNTKRRGIR